MRKTIYILLAFLFLTLIPSGCDKSDGVGPSQIDITPPNLTDLDIWLRESFVNPYNIEIQYKWNINETDVARYLHPPYTSSVRPVAEALLKTWIEPYNQLGGEDFIKKLAPRQFTLAGSFNYNPNSPTITLGVAEAGAKITLFNIDYLDFTNVNSIKRPLKTVQHEYGHILNQTRPIDPAFEEINPANYTGQWFNRTDAQARALGYITSYASSSHTEDFVEMIAEMLTHSKADFDAILDNIRVYDADGNVVMENGEPIMNTYAIDVLRRKEQMVVDYYKKEFNIDFYELQQLTEEATLELVQ